MVVDIYAINMSPPCRAVFLVAKAIGLDYNFKIVDLQKGENRTPEFLKMNPAHTVPVMTDESVTLGESKAIITYFMNKYATDSNQNLYPTDPAARALVNQRLYFDAQLFASLRGIVFPILVLKDLKQSQANMPKVEENMNLLETFLTRSTYLAGEELSIADLATLASVSGMAGGGLDLARWPHINAWFSKLKSELPYYEEACGKGANMLSMAYMTTVKKLERK